MNEVHIAYANIMHSITEIATDWKRHSSKFSIFADMLQRDGAFTPLNFSPSLLPLF